MPRKKKDTATYEQTSYRVEMPVSPESTNPEPARRPRNEEIRERQELAGIPESKRFGGSPESDAEFDRRPIMQCHVGGVPMTEMPVTVQRALSYEQTDEGFAEKQKGRKGYGASVTRDAVDNTLRERAHDLRQNPEDYRQAADPLKFLKPYEKPGWKLKLLSDKRGSLDPDYELVMKPNGDALKYKRMFVGRRRTEEVQERKRYYKNKSDRRMKALTERFSQESEGGAVIPKENVIPA